MQSVTVLTFNEPREAEPIKARLVGAGIPAEIHDERNLQRYGFLAEPLAGIRVRVDSGQFESAQKLLKNWENQEPMLAQAIHCPACGCSRVEYPQFTRKFLLPSFAVLLCRLRLIQPKFYCQECQYTWSPKLLTEAERDSLGWPKR